MGFLELLTLATALLQREKRISCRALGRIFELDDACLEDLKFELVHAKRLADQDGEVLIWAEQPETTVHAHLLPSAAEPVLLPQVIERPEPGAPPAETTPAEGERRQLTVMFCDLVKSTELSTRLDPEDLGVIIRDYQETCAKVIAQFDGYIAKYMGDGILVYFGYPKAHENEAERAVMSGLGIIEALADFEPKYARDIKLTVRIGIATGLVVVGEIIGDGSAEEITVVGETPNIAARLQALAKPNTMVISSATHKLIEAEFRCEDLGGLQLKGVAEPIHAWRVVGLAEAEHEGEESGVADGFPLVGRDEEIGLLLRRLAQSKDRLGQAVLISGEAGIGKSALAETVGAQAKKEGFARTTFHFSPYYTNSALYPVIEQIKRRSRWQAGNSPYTKLAKLEQMLANYNWAAEEVVPLFAALVSLPLPAGRYPPLNLTPQEQKQRTLDALVAWTLEEAERRPIFELWDDLHWADPTTLELLGLLINQAATAPLLMVMTFRPEFIPPWPTRSHMTPITLSRLEGPDVEAMVTRLASGKPLPAEVVQHIVKKTDGVPLYVEELTKVILESGLLREESDRYDLTGPLSAVTIPATLQGNPSWPGLTGCPSCARWPNSAPCSDANSTTKCSRPLRRWTRPACRTGCASSWKPSSSISGGAHHEQRTSSSTLSSRTRPMSRCSSEPDSNVTGRWPTSGITVSPDRRNPAGVIGSPPHRGEFPPDGGRVLAKGRPTGSPSLCGSGGGWPS